MHVRTKIQVLTSNEVEATHLKWRRGGVGPKAPPFTSPQFHRHTALETHPDEACRGGT